MNLTLCGLGIPNEHIFFYKVTAQRIHKHAEEDDSVWQNGWDCYGGLLSTITDCQGIIRAIDTGTLKDINGHLISRIVLKDELLILAQDAKKISNAIKKNLNISPDFDIQVDNFWNRNFSIREQCDILDHLAKQMLISSKMYDDNKQESLLLLGATDQTSLLSVIPNDVIKHILNMCFEVDFDLLSNYPKKYIK